MHYAPKQHGPQCTILHPPDWNVYSDFSIFGLRCQGSQFKKGFHIRDEMRQALSHIDAGMSIRRAAKDCKLSYHTVLYCKIFLQMTQLF